MEIFTKSARETAKAGARLGSKLKGGETLALEGELGSGKTTFIQGLAAGLGIKKRIISPTFILLRRYDARRKSLYHLDLYRIWGDARRELRSLGIIDIWQERKNIVAIEWADKVRDLLPAKTTWIKFKNLDGDTRQITIV